MKFITEDDTLTIKLEGIEVFFGLKRRLVLPRANITNVEWQPAFIFTGRLWRMGGSGIPGVLYAGRFRAAGDNYYLYMQQPAGVGWVNGVVRASNVLVITMHDYRYKQIWLTSNPDIAGGVINWWRGSSRPS
jgi:hypothetical protein